MKKLFAGLVGISIVSCVIFCVQAKDNWKAISIPTYPEVWILKNDVHIEGRIEIFGQGCVTKVTIKEGAKVYFKEE